MNNASKPILPLEIVLRIVDFAAPCDPHAIVPSDDDTTKTLLSWMLVSRATSWEASKLFRRHCMYIDSSDKAKGFAYSLQISSQPSAKEITDLFLAPFPEDEDLEVDDSSSSFLSPLDDPTTVEAAKTILVAVAPTLRRLVIDMPLRSMYPEDDHNKVRPVLRHAFASLINMEEFVSVKDELFLAILGGPRPTYEPEVWATCWPKLRRLALYNVVLEPDDMIWDEMANLKDLETAVFTRADASEYQDCLDVKGLWVKACKALKEDDNDQDAEIRPFTLVHIDNEFEQFSFAGMREDWAKIDPNERIRVMRADVGLPFHDPSVYIDQAQSLVRDFALRGLLFDMDAIGAYND